MDTGEIQYMEVYEEKFFSLDDRAQIGFCRERNFKFSINIHHSIPLVVPVQVFQLAGLANQYNICLLLRTYFFRVINTYLWFQRSRHRTVFPNHSSP